MEHGGRKMRLAAGEWPRFSCCQADKWTFCARRALNFSLFLPKTNFFKHFAPIFTTVSCHPHARTGRPRNTSL